MDNHFTVWSASDLCFIWAKWQALGLKLRESDIRIAIHAGEPGASVLTSGAASRNTERDADRRHGEVGAGLSPVSRKTTHSISTNGVHFEVVDPQTGQRLHRGVAGVGCRNLSRAGMPVIRYRTGDLVGSSIVSLRTPDGG
jgi:hypothetical protein